MGRRTDRLIYRWMDGGTDGCMDGSVNVWTDRRMDGQMSGQTNELSVLKSCVSAPEMVFQKLTGFIHLKLRLTETSLLSSNQNISLVKT